MELHQVTTEPRGGDGDSYRVEITATCGGDEADVLDLLQGADVVVLPAWEYADLCKELATLRRSRRAVAPVDGDE